MGVGSQFSVFSSQKKRPIITLLLAAPDYSSEAAVFWKERALLIGKNGAEARRAVVGPGGAAEFRLLGWNWLLYGTAGGKAAASRRTPKGFLVNHNRATPLWFL
jgi:hypothetical protein